MRLIERLEAAMDSQYIQEHPDEVIELLVEVKAEIERLKDLKSFEKFIDDKIHGIGTDLQCEYVTPEARAEAFEKELERLCNVSIVRAEAYKEVWEVLRNKCDAPYWCVWLSEIDDFFEKLVGESNG